VGLTIYFDDKQLKKYLGSAAKRWPDAAGRALEKVGRAVYNQSQAEVPKGKTGILEHSVFLYVSPKTVLISYFAPYARIVHFRKHVHHPEGKRKFLTGPLGKGKRILGPTISQEVEAEIGKMGSDG